MRICFLSLSSVYPDFYIKLNFQYFKLTHSHLLSKYRKPKMIVLQYTYCLIKNPMNLLKYSKLGHRKWKQVSRICCIIE